MENQDLNNLFCRQVKAVKRTEDILSLIHI